MKEQDTLRALAPPIIREAADGGLGYDDVIENPWRCVTAQVKEWGRLVAGDTIEILWGPSLAPVASHVYRTEEDWAPLISIDVARIYEHGEGLMAVAAKLTTVDSGESQVSDSAPIIVKFTVPGGLDETPSTPYLNERLAPPSVSPNPLPDDFGGVAVVIPPYEHMSAGDTLSVRWQGMAITRPALSADEVGRPVRIPIDREMAKSTAGEDVTVCYQVYDIVGNWSRWSPSAVVRVPPDEGSLPAAPWVTGTTDDIGRELKLEVVGTRPVIVRVENHPVPAGTSISILWEGVTATGKALVYRTEEQRVQRPGQTLDFSVPNARVTELAGGEVSVSYAFVLDGVPKRSKRRHLTVVGQVQPLQPPALREAHAGSVDPDRTAGGAHVDVLAWPGLDRDDRCFLEWTGQRADGTPTFFNASLSGADLGADGILTFRVPGEEVARVAGGRLRVRYSVAVHTPVRSGHGLRTEPLVQISSPWLELVVGELKVPLSIDSTPATLSAPIIRTEKRVTVPPAGAFVARMATGGVPPYRYSASSGAVEVDEATGRVVSLRNGDAVVTVTDAKGATASYPVSVSGVLHLVDLGSEMMWGYASAAAAKAGGRVPHVEEWDAMRAVYGGEPGIRENAAWSDTPANSVTRYVVFPATGVREVRRSSLTRLEPDERWIPVGPTLGTAWAWVILAPTA